MKDVVARAAYNPVALMCAIGKPDLAGIKVLHWEADITVVNLAETPHQIKLQHNHHLAAVIGRDGECEDGAASSTPLITRSRRSGKAPGQAT